MPLLDCWAIRSANPSLLTSVLPPVSKVGCGPPPPPPPKPPKPPPMMGPPLPCWLPPKVPPPPPPPFGPPLPPPSAYVVHPCPAFVAGVARRRRLPPIARRGTF